MAVKPLRKAHDEDRMDLSCMSHTECSLEEMNLQPGDELVLESLLKLGSVYLRTLGLEMTIASSDLGRRCAVGFGSKKPSWKVSLTF